MTAVVGDAEPAAGIEVSELDAGVGQLAPELRGALGGDQHWLDVEKLGADVEGDSDRLECVVGRRSAERLRRLVPVEPELGPNAAGGQVLVPAAFDPRVQADGDGRRPPGRARSDGDLVELLDRLDIQRADAEVDGRADLVLALADP